MSRPRRKFDREFRDGAVRIVKETGRPVAHVVRELGVCERMLGKRVREDRTERAAGCRRIDEGLFAHTGCLSDRGGVVRRQREPVAGQHPVHGGVRHRACLQKTDAEPLEGGQLAVPQPSQSAACVLAPASSAFRVGVGQGPFAALDADRHRYQVARGIPAISQNRATVTPPPLGGRRARRSPIQLLPQISTKSRSVSEILTRDS